MPARFPLSIFALLRTIGRMDIFYYLGLAASGFGAGLIGALLGLGGGVFIVPALVLIFHLPTIVAVGASNVASVATSTTGASTYVRQRLSNIRLGLLLLISTTLAATASSLVAKYLPNQLLSGLFGVMLLYTAITMLRGRRQPGGAKANEGAVTLTAQPAPEHSNGLGLEGRYHDPSSGESEDYSPRHVPAGMGVSVLAGVVAGLLGVGGGIVQVPVMNLLMNVPLKVAAATSSYMIGFTSTGAAFVRYSNGDVDPLVAVPIVLFVIIGARVGAWLAPRTPNDRLRRIFGWVAIAVSALMLAQAVGLYKR